MAYTVRPDGSVVCDTAEEAVTMSRSLAAAHAPGPVVGESISSDRWKAVHAHDKRISAAVERLKAGQEFFGDLTPLQRQCCEMRVAGKWPHEIGKELGRTTGTIQAIIWDAQKRLRRRAAGEALPTQAEISKMGGRAAAAKRAARERPAPPEEPAPPVAALPRKPQRCKKCGGDGHNARTCKGAKPGIIPAPLTDGEPTNQRKNIPKDIPPARLYVVSEDFEEEDGTAWIEGDVWQAIEPTGETVENHQQFKLRRQGDGVDGVGFPSLHPFVAHDARAATRPLHAVTIPRVGMGPGARAAG
jgi:hypothetical protein